MKHCNRCDTTKPRAAFHKRAASKDGLAACCKACQKEYDAARLSDPKRAAHRAEYSKGKGKGASTRAKQRYIQRNPKKRKAHSVIQCALIAGKIFKTPCEICGETKVHGHHDDYDKPMEVRWLCDTHHNEWHRKYGEALNPF